MTRIISAIIILVCAGLLVADPIANNCMDSIDVNKNMVVDNMNDNRDLEII